MQIQSDVCKYKDQWNYKSLSGIYQHLEVSRYYLIGGEIIIINDRSIEI